MALTINPITPVISAEAAGPAVTLQPGSVIIGQWWTLFHSHELDETLAFAVDNNPTLDTARATLAQAQQAIVVARAGYYPEADLAAGAQRERVSAGGFANPAHATGTLFSIGPTVSYGPDQFHPSRLGTYLAAAVVYTGLTGDLPRALPRDVAGLHVSAGVARALRASVARVYAPR